MNKQFPLSEMEELITESIKEKGTFTFVPNGISMLPLFRPGTDTAILTKVPDKLSSGDVVFYKRKNGQYVLHRIIFTRKKGFILCGDNQKVFEAGIDYKNMIALVKGIIRDGEVVEFSDNKLYHKYQKKILAKKRLRFLIWLIPYLMKKHRA